MLHRPYHIYDYLPPIYPEMEEAENPQQSMTSLDHEMGHHIKDEIKKESSGIPAENSDLHPLREIASVMMTSSGFISPAREGRMADSRTPALSKLATNNTNLFEDDNSRPGSTDSGMKTKPKAANDTSDEGLIEDDDEVPAPIKSSGGSKLSVFQKKKNQTTKDESGKKAMASSSSQNNDEASEAEDGFQEGKIAKMASKMPPRRPRWPPRLPRWPQDASKTAQEASNAPKRPPRRPKRPPRGPPGRPEEIKIIDFH